jgi:heterodisulfide reductase subunit B
MRYLYYPGCSQKASSRSYEEAFLAVCSKLGAELVELDDWNCCGATMAISYGRLTSLALTARNLALAERQQLPVVTPCPGCWLSFARVNHLFQDDAVQAERVRDALTAGDLDYRGTVQVHHVLEFLIGEIGLDRIRSSVVRPLSALRVAPYYGCQIVRPYGVGDKGGELQDLELLVAALGATAVASPLRMTCCGSSLMATNKKLAEGLCLKILKSFAAEADLVVTPCGLCQVNLGMAQRDSGFRAVRKAELPILSIAQLIGLAIGLPENQLSIPRSVSALAGQSVAKELVTAA